MRTFPTTLSLLFCIIIDFPTQLAFNSPGERKLAVEFSSPESHQKLAIPSVSIEKAIQEPPVPQPFTSSISLVQVEPPPANNLYADPSPNINILPMDRSSSSSEKEPKRGGRGSFRSSELADFILSRRHSRKSHGIHLVPLLRSAVRPKHRNKPRLNLKMDFADETTTKLHRPRVELHIGGANYGRRPLLLDLADKPTTKLHRSKSGFRRPPLLDFGEEHTTRLHRSRGSPRRPRLLELVGKATTRMNRFKPGLRRPLSYNFADKMTPKFFRSVAELSLLGANYERRRARLSGRLASSMLSSSSLAALLLATSSSSTSLSPLTSPTLMTSTSPTYSSSMSPASMSSLQIFSPSMTSSQVSPAPKLSLLISSPLITSSVTSSQSVTSSVTSSPWTTSSVTLSQSATSSVTSLPSTTSSVTSTLSTTLPSSNCKTTVGVGPPSLPPPPTWPSLPPPPTWPPMPSPPWPPIPAPTFPPRRRKPHRRQHRRKRKKLKLKTENSSQKTKPTGDYHNIVLNINVNAGQSTHQLMVNNKASTPKDITTKTPTSTTTATTTTTTTTTTITTTTTPTTTTTESPKTTTSKPITSAITGISMGNMFNNDGPPEEDKSQKQIIVSLESPARLFQHRILTKRWLDQSTLDHSLPEPRSEPVVTRNPKSSWKSSLKIFCYAIIAAISLVALAGCLILAVGMLQCKDFFKEKALADKK